MRTKKRGRDNGEGRKNFKHGREGKIGKFCTSKAYMHCSEKGRGLD